MLLCGTARVISGSFNRNFWLRKIPFFSVDESVPAFWELIRKSIEGQIAQTSPISQALFWGSMWMKDKMMSYGIPGTSIFDTLIFNKYKEIIGGNVFWSIYGGVGLAEDTERFVCTALCPMAGAYGLTETCAYVLTIDKY